MLAPGQVQDSAPVGSMAATADSLSVANGGPGTLSWVAHLANGESWLAFVGPNSGTAPATLRIAFNPAGLPTGVYRDTVVVDAENAANSPGRVPLEFTVHPCVPTPLVVNAPPLTDSLTTADCTAPHRSTSFARLYSFVGTAGDSVSIVMSSNAVDAFVALDTSADNAAPALATNDSCSGGTDACLRYQVLPVAGTYRVEATSAGAGQTGRFTLSVTRPRAPAAAQSLAQLRSDSVTAIAIGGTTDQGSVVLRGLVGDPDPGDSLRLQVELQLVGTAFTGTPTATGARVANGQTALVAATGLANNAAYHWQARTLDQTGRAGPWTAFGGNAESATDFSTSIPVPPNAPTVLGQFQSDGKTAIAVGGTATGRSVIFKATVTDSNPGDQLRLDVEAEPVGTAFQNTPSGSGAPVANNGVATATVAGLSDNTAYHWQARAVDQTGRAGPWASFGSNPETATDFRVAVAVTQLAFTGQPGTTVAGVAISPAVQVTAQDALGNTVTSFAGNVTVAIANNAGGGTLSGTLTVAAVNGVASFSTLSIDKVGSGYTLTGSATGLTANSGPFAITPAAGKQLFFTVQPTDAPAGSPITPAVQVTARDTFGNIATAFTGNVSVAIGNNAGGGTLSGATTQSAVAGVATFGTLSIDKTGAGYTLIASGTGLVAATSAGFAVTPAAATRLVFTVQPVSTTAGIAITPAVQVTAQDNLGNTVTTFTGTVTIAIGNNPGGGTLSGTVSRAAVGGVAGFPGLSIDKSGTGYTLSASAPGTAAAASAAFNITPAAATQLVFTVEPAATTAGTAIAPAVQVTARDALGNTATGFTGNVTVAIGTNPGGGTLSGALTVAATAGIATFANLSVDKSGSGYTLTAAATGVTGSASAAFDIRPGAATRLAFTAEPTSGAANVALAPPVQVTAQDAFGNRDTTYTGSVAVAVAANPGGATLSGTTSVAAAAGIATFATLRLDKAGTGYTLTATGTGLTAATSTSFNIVAGTVSASLSTVSATPGVIAASAGGAAATITVTAKDASGNAIPGATVVLAATGTANALTQPLGPTDATGSATGTLSSTVAELKTVSATINGVAVTQTATVTVSPASVSATHSSLATAPATIVASSGANAATITVTAHDGFDNPIAGATVVLAATGSGVTLTQPAGGTNASGVATGSVSATLVGQKIISATINGVSVAQADTLAVGPAGAAELAFSVQPNNSTAGSTITPAVQVTARDQFGNTATGFTAGVTVALGANPGGGVLTGTLTRNAVAGVATFADLSINKAGSGYTLTAAATGLPVAPSSAFDVAAGTGTQLVFTVQPTSDTARAILSPAIQVTAQDPIGNTITSFTGNVTVALGANPGGATLAGTTTVAAVNGVATFSTLSVAKSGTGYTLIASSTTAGYNTPSSAPFNITPGATSKLVFTAQPTNTVAGSTITPAVQVTAHDASDNVTPAFTGNVTMAIGTNPGTGVLSGTITRAAVAGVASFNDLSINKAGVGYTFAAAASGVTSGTSGAFSIAAGSAAALAVTRQPSATGQSGAALTVQPQAQLRDANGNNVAQGNVTITAAIATGPAGATLAGTTALTDAGGQATFSGLAITGPAGSYRLAFTSGTLVPDTSTVIVLSAGAAAQLALTTQPSAAVANDVVFPQQPVAQLQDAAGNPVNQSGVVVTAALATGNPALGGTLTATTNASGAAAFATLRITGVVGSRTVSFGATGLTGVTSTAVVVSAGAATQIAGNGGNNQAATAATAVGTPPSVIVRDVSGNVVAGVPVSFAVPGTSNGSLTGPNPTTNAGGIATVGSWTLSTTAKPDTMTATSTGLAGSPVTFVDTAKVGAATTLAKFSGDNLTGQVGTTLSTPHVVLVSDANGNPVPNVTISWAAASGGGSVNPTSSVTGTDGKASTTRTLGPIPGTQTTTANSSGLTTVTFSITAQVGGATQMAFADSSVRHDTVGHTIPAALAVKVMDALNNPVQGVTMSWAVLNGGGSVNPVSSVTNAAGIATTSWTLGTVMSPTDSTQFVQASGVASPLTFTGYTVPGPVSAAQTSVTASSPITASTGSSASTITVTARDQYGNVIKGKTVTLAATGTANTLTNPAAPTDVNGTATGTLTSTKAETKVITATVSGVSVAQQPAVVVNPDVASNLNFVGQPTGAVAGTTIAPAVTGEIRDQFNNRVTTATNGVGLAIGTNPGAGTLTGGGTVSAASGVATFSALSIDKVGSGYTLTALSTGLASATSAVFNIAAAGVSASHSTVVATSPITAGGAPSTITVTALDQFNNPIQGATVVLAATGSGNTMTQPVGTTNAGGVATGTLASTVAEAKTVSATIGGVAVTQTAIVAVNPGGAATLAFTQQPSSAVAGTAITPTIQVTARDANGNVATAFTGAVGLAIANNAGGGTLSGGGPVTAVNGVASFSNVSIDKVGTGYTLTASATGGGPTAAASGGFNIAPAAATALVFTVQPASAVAGSAIAPAVQITARDDFGNTAAGFTGTVSIAIGANPGGGTLSGTLSKPAAAGVVSFADLAINKTGNGYTLTATGTGPAGGTSGAFNITPAGATQLVFSEQPSNVVAGVAFSPAVTVTALDANNNVATGFAGSVSLAIGANPGGATLSGGGPVTAVNGVAAFAGASLNKVGNGYTVTAASTGLTGAASTTFNVTPAAASALAFTGQPSNVVAGTAITPAVQVTARDQFGNAATGFAGNVSVAIGTNPSAGVLSGTLTQPASGGVATFGDLSLDKAGSGYTLTASSGSLTGGTSTTFGVSPAPAKQLVFTVQPTNAVSGTAIAPPVQVTARDQFGNTDTTYAASVTVAIVTNPGGGTLSGATAVAAAHGVATFSTLAIDKVGTGYQLGASATSLSGTASTAFNITPAAATQLVFAQQPTDATAGVAISPAITVSALDGSGNAATGFTGNVTIAIANNAGGGTLSGTVTVAAVAGVAAFSNLSINKAGAGYTLAASATGLTGATSTGFAITSAAASQLAFTVQPTTQSAGVSITPGVQVSARDAFGNTVPGFTSAVTVAIGTNPGAGTLSGTTSVSAVSGVATFADLSINKTGTGYTLTASAAGVGGTTSSAFNITPAAAAQLVFTRQPPANTAAGANMTPGPRVTAQDQFGNVVTSFTGGITMAIGTNPGSGTLSGTTTVAAVGGVATFTTLRINKSGTGYTLVATNDGLTPGTSTLFNITAAAATQVMFVQQPSNTTAGASISPAVTVAAQDLNGNVVTTFTGNVTVALAANPGGGTLSGTLTQAASAGVATFSNLSINKASAGYTLATSSGTLVKDTSTAFTIAADGVSASLSTVTASSPITASSGTSPSTATVTAKDQFGNPIQGSSVTLAASGTGNNVTQPVGPTDVNGVATGTLSSTVAESKTVSATIGGVAITQTAPVVVNAAAPTSAAVNAGNGQSATVNTAVTTPPSVILRDQFNNPVPGVAVTFAVTGGAGTVSPPTPVTTDATGIATVTSWTLGPAAGPNTLTGTATGSGISGNPVTFTATGTAGAPTQIAVNAGNNQSATVGSTVAIAPSVIVRDASNNPASGVSVTFAVASGGGTVNPTSAVTTGANGIASATSWTLGTAAGTNTLTATASGTGINGNPLTFTATGTPGTATALVFTAQPGNGTAGATLTPPTQVTARDQFGNTATSFGSGVTLTIGNNPGGGTLTGGGPVTAVSGVATFSTVSIDKVGVGYTLVASGGSLTSGPTAAFNLTAGGVSASQSSVVATSPITAGGGTSAITVTARDANGNPIQGLPVVLAATGTGNTLTQPIGTTNASGVATGTLSSTVAEMKTVSATINSVAITQTASVSVNPGAVSAAQSTVVATSPITAGSGTSTITVTAKDASGNVIPGATVTLAATGTNNTLTQPATTTDANGQATGTLTSTKAEAKTVSATINAVAITQTATVTVNAGAPSAAQSSVAATSPITAGAGTSTITVTVKDASGNPIQGATVTLAASPTTGNTMTQPVGTTDANGQITGSLSSTKAETKTVTATVDGSVTVTQTAPVVVNPGPASAAQSTVAATSPITASTGTSQSTITVTAKDANGNLIQGATVVLAASGTGNTFTQPVGTTNASGVATGTLSSTVAESKTVSATINGVAVTQTAPVVVNSGTATVLVFTVQPGNGTAGATLTPPTQVTARDQFGNTATSFGGGVKLTIGANPGGGTLTGGGPMTALSGVATFSGLSIDKAGVGYTLIATSGSLTQDTTTAFDITAGGVSASQSTVAAASPVSVGSPSTITVTAKDGLGNPVQGATVVLAATGTGNTLTQPAVNTNASGVATGTLWSSVAESKTVSATINGVAITQTATVAVNAAATTTTIATHSPNPSVVGQGIAVTYSVTSAGGTPTGNVTVSDGPASCIGTVAAGTCTLTPTTAGAKTLTATYAGDGNFVGSTSVGVAHTVNAANTTTTITGNTPNPSAVGQTVGFTYTVVANAPGSGTPTGTVTVSDGTQSCSATVAAGSCGIAFNSAGPRSVTASYASDGNFASSTSTAVSQSVGAASTTTTITSHTPSPSVTGQPVAVAFTVTSSGGTPTGNVTVSDGTATCVGTVAAGTCTLTPTTTGTKTLTAAYAGDGNFAPSTSAGVSHTVNAASTATTITGNTPNPSAVGQAVSFTVTVVTNAPGAGTPTGTVTVSDGTEHCSASVGAGGCTIAFGSAGARSVTASYAGDGNFGASTSSSVSQSVAAASTTTTITGHTPNPSSVGQGIAVTYSVTSTGGTPTGNVTVSDGAASCVGSVGAGGCTLTPTTAGAKTFTATYAGDANFAGSISTGVSHTVNAASTATAITGHTPSPSVTGQPVAATFTVTSSGGTPTGNVTVSDGSATCIGAVSAGTCTLTPTTAGGKTLTAAYAGDGNFTASTSSGVAHAVNQASTTATITTHTPNPSAVGQVVSFTYTVAANAPGSGTPTGTVTVTDGTQSCSASVAAGSCAIAFSSAGSRSVTASYPGDVNFGSSTSTSVSQVVGAAATTTTITDHTPSPSLTGQPVAVAFTVTSSGGTPTGNVTVSDGAATCSGTVAAGTCTLTPTTTGAKTLTATYAGDANFGGSVSAGVAHTVNKAGTGSTITAHTPNPSTVGQTVSITFAVAVNAPGSGTPTGTVNVTDGTFNCSASVTTGGCSIAFPTAGGRTLTATYAGDANFTGSASAGAIHMVNAASTTTTITANTPNPSAVGQQVSVTFSVVANAPASGTPTGTVTVSDGTLSCNASVSTGSCAIAFPSAGVRSLTASYAGDGNFSASTSAPVSHTVGAASTTTTITGHAPNPSVVGQGIPVTFAVTSSGGTPTGNVTVTDGAATCSGTVATGTCSLTPTTAGGKTLTATYAGDGNFATSTSTGVSHTVNAANTTTTITANTPNPSVVGQPVGFTFTVLTNAPGSGTPTGTVTVSDGTQTCSASVSVGTCSIAFTSAGGRTVTATYASDGNFAASTSGGASQTVNAAATTTAITGDTPDPSAVGQPYTVSYTVAVSAPGSGSPTGNVTVSDGVATCTGTVASGSCQLTSLTPGGKTLTASYVGNANFAGSTSAGEAHTVNLTGTSTAITTHTPDPSVVGQGVAVSFSVTPTGGGIPTGNVTVSDGAANCTVAVAVGTCTLTPTTAGAKTLVASYAGDGTFASSTSPGVSQTVNPASTTTAITSNSPNPSVAGEAIAVHFTVTSAGGTPTGNVTVSDGSVSCIASVSVGTCNVTPTVAGAKTLTATYAGDANFSGSTSTGVSQTVNPAVAASIAVQVGNGQTATVGTAVAIPPSVIVRDQFGNPVPGVAVTFAVASGGGTVNPTTSVATGTDGIAATTSWTLGTIAGTNTLTATSGSLSGSPVSFTATGTAGAATQLTFTVQPSNIAILGVITPPVQVTALDAFGNTATSFTGNVVIAIGNDASVLKNAKLGGTLTVAATSGVASFADLTIDQAGAGYTLVVSATGPTGATSNAFTVL